MAFIINALATKALRHKVFHEVVCGLIEFVTLRSLREMHLVAHTYLCYPI